MKQRIFSILTALVFCLTLLPTAAFAEGEPLSQQPVCTCEVRCTEENRNEGCPVCGAEDALLEDCTAALSANAAPIAYAGNATRTQTTGELWLGGVNVLEHPSGSGPNGGSYSYENATLTLTNYVAEGTNYKEFSSGSTPTAAYLYTTVQALRINLVGDCRLGATGNTNDYLSGSDKKIRTVGVCSTAQNSYLYINAMGQSSGNLEVNSHVWPVVLSHITIGAGTISLNSGMQGCLIRGVLTMTGGTVSMASKLDGRFTYCGAQIDAGLTIGPKGSLTVSSNGTAYNRNGNIERPVAMKVGGEATVRGNLTVTSDGSNKGDGCQGRALEVSTLKIYDGGSVKAFSNGYNEDSKTYDGREAIYISNRLDIDASSLLYAKTQNPATDNNNFTAHGALYLANENGWNLTAKNKDGTFANNTAVLTIPAQGYISPKYHVVFNGAYAAKAVEIRGLRSAMLTFGLNEGKKVLWYRGALEHRVPTGRVEYERYLQGETFNLTKGFLSSTLSVGPRDYMGFYGIDVRQGEHTIMFNSIVQDRSNPYITVRDGATLNLELTSKTQNYLENTRSGTAPAIKVEAGGTLNVIGTGRNTALSLRRGISAERGANVCFQNCIVYASDTIGGAGANVSFENCWVSAATEGLLTIKSSTVSGAHSNGRVIIDRVSNADLRGQNGILPTDVVGTDFVPVYQTTIQLENFSDSINKDMILFLSTRDGDATLKWCTPATKLRMKIGSQIVAPDQLDLVIEGNMLRLWLPVGTEVENVYGFDDGSATAVGFVHEAVSTIKTTRDNAATGTMRLRNLLLGSGILALKGTPATDNTELCAGYQENGQNEWIAYEPEKEIKLQSEYLVTGFGIRALPNSGTDINLNALRLIGNNKRVTVDSGAALKLLLHGENSMQTQDNSNDAVLNLTGSLTIHGAEGEKKLTLRGKRAIEGSSSASLTITNSMIISECTDKTTAAMLGRLTIQNSTVTGLGLIDCPNIIIDGGSVDLTVPDGTVVKDSNGNILEKSTLTFDEKNTKVDDLTISGLPEGSSFDSSNITTDSGGKINVWLPEGAAVVSATIGGTVYYPRSSGSMTTGEQPQFSVPQTDRSFPLREGQGITLSVTAAGTPAPALQWQKNTDGGTTWQPISGATGADYKVDSMSTELHGAKYRCVATNRFGETTHQAESKVFTLYYLPLTYGGRVAVKSGDDMPFTVKFDADLNGIAASYQWYKSNDRGQTWLLLPHATGRTHTEYAVDPSITAWRYRCIVTFTYEDGTTSEPQDATFYSAVVETPVISKAPVDQTVGLGQAAEFSVSTGENSSGLYVMYQWQVKKSANGAFEDIESATKTSYTAPAATMDMNGWQYRCIVINEGYGVRNPIPSSAATLTVVSAPDITAQPQNAAVIYNTDAVFAITATGSDAVSYQWQVKKTADGAFEPINGATESAYTVSAVTVDMSGWQYRCVVTNEINGATSSIESAVATLTVTPLPIAIPAADKTVFTYNGQPQTYGIAATEAYTVSGSTETAANERGYTVTLALNDKRNTQWDDGTTEDKTYSFVIHRAALTIAAKDLALSTGDVPPALGESHYTVSGLVEGDALITAPTLQYVDATGNVVLPDMTINGEYTIRIDGAATSDNYSIAYVNGKLRITKRPGRTFTFRISIADARNGTVTASSQTAAQGATINVAAKPNSGYTLEALTATDRNGNALKLTDLGGGNYAFTMPGAAVTIAAKFAANGGESGTFRDVSDEAYYAPAVRWATEKKITGGIGNGLFAPDQPCTRAQIITFLWRAAGSPVVNHVMTFADVPEDAYYAEAVRWALSERITTGTGEATFSPDLPCTRAQAVTFLYRALRANATSGSAAFSDVPVDSYYADAVAWAVEHDVTNGMGNGLFQPDAVCTRAQIVTFLYRAYRGE